DHTEATERGAPIVQWVPEDAEDCTVVMPDAEEVEGLVEPGIPEEVVQFVRFGFVNVVDSEGSVEAYYTHP
ncbi:MAG: glutamate--tRNA ligase, partial [Candidatus Nanohaloarchaea archaeon]